MSEIVDLTSVLPWHPTQRWGQRSLRVIRSIIVHQALADGTIEAINDYHITPNQHNHLSARGAPHFAYHYGIRKAHNDGGGGPEGQIVQTNTLADVSWHTRGQNRTSVGIVLEGNFKGPGHKLTGLDEGPSDKQMSSLDWLVEHLRMILHLDPQDLFGHYHFGKRACPGFAISAWIEKYRLQRIGVTSNQVGEIESVQELQEALVILGYDPGEIDGLMGPRTARAIRAFQREQNLIIDGIPGSQTRQRLLVRLRNNGVVE